MVYTRIHETWLHSQIDFFFFAADFVLMLYPSLLSKYRFCFIMDLRKYSLTLSQVARSPLCHGVFLAWWLHLQRRKMPQCEENSQKKKLYSQIKAYMTTVALVREGRRLTGKKGCRLKKLSFLSVQSKMQMTENQTDMILRNPNFKNRDSYRVCAQECVHFQSVPDDKAYSHLEPWPYRIHKCRSWY